MDKVNLKYSVFRAYRLLLVQINKKSVWKWTNNEKSLLSYTTISKAVKL